MSLQSIWDGTVEAVIGGPQTLVDDQLPWMDINFYETENEKIDDAADEQLAALDKSIAENKRQFDLGRQDMMPWLEKGKKALGRLDYGMDRGQFDAGSFDYQEGGGYKDPQYQGDPQYKDIGDFSLGDLENDPGYQFRLAQGQKAIERSAAAQGQLGSGRTLKGLLEFGQGMASQEYGNAFQRHQQQRGFNRGEFESDRASRRGQYESDRGFGRGKYQDDRSFGYDTQLNEFNSRRNQKQDRYNRLANMAGVGQQTSANLANLSSGYASQQGQNYMNQANINSARTLSKSSPMDDVMDYTIKGLGVYKGLNS